VTRRKAQWDGLIHYYVGEYNDYVLDKDNGPSVIHSNGAEIWMKNGCCHREDGPALIGEDGIEIWCRDGNIHREDGPAVIGTGGLKEYWLFGKWYAYMDWLIKVQEIQGTSSGQ
jgi:hypothetical protein